MSPILQTAIRSLAILGVEWTTLTLLESTTAWVKIATLALAVAVLGVLELRERLAKKAKWAFWGTLSGLVAIYALTGGIAYVWSMPQTQSWNRVFPWLLAAFGVLAVATAVYREFKPAPVTVPVPLLDGQAHLDLLHLFDFGIDQTTFVMLEMLIDKSTAPESNQDAFGPDQAHKARNLYISFVCKKLDGDRLNTYVNLLRTAQTEAEFRLREIPQDQRPAGDPLTVREHAISQAQFTQTVLFLKHQRREVEERLIVKRCQLIERRDLRKK